MSILFYQPPEPIYKALFALLAPLGVSGDPLFPLVSRRWQHWEDVAPENQPAVFQVQPDPGTMTYEWKPDGAPLIRARAEFVIYCRTEETLITAASSKLNLCVGRVLAMLEPPAYTSTARLPLYDVDTGAQVAYDARVNGDISTVEGVASNNAQSVAYIPIDIRVTF